MRKEKQKTKSYAVIGLGRFGMSVAQSLAEANCDLLVVDDSEENIQQIQDEVADAVCADVTEPGVMERIGIQNMDVVVIGISENKEASITATFQAKDLGVPYVIAKAINPLHGKILSRVGADEVVFPESATGSRIGKKLVTGHCTDLFEISDEYSMVELPIPEKWIGENLVDLKLRKNHNVNMLGIRKNDRVDINVEPTKPLPKNCTVILLGKNEDLAEF